MGLWCWALWSVQHFILNSVHSVTHSLSSTVLSWPHAGTRTESGVTVGGGDGFGHINSLNIDNYLVGFSWMFWSGNCQPKGGSTQSKILRRQGSLNIVGMCCWIVAKNDENFIFWDSLAKKKNKQTNKNNDYNVTTNNRWKVPLLYIILSFLSIIIFRQKNFEKYRSVRKHRL